MAKNSRLEDLMLETSVLNTLKNIGAKYTEMLNQFKERSKKGDALFVEEDLSAIINAQIQIINLLFDYFSAKIEITKLDISDNKKDYKIDVQ